MSNEDIDESDGSDEVVEKALVDTLGLKPPVSYRHISHKEFDAYIMDCLIAEHERKPHKISPGSTTFRCMIWALLNTLNETDPEFRQKYRRAAYRVLEENLKVKPVKPVIVET